ncbi:MAG: site-2 protease family protein [Candidatus Hadarchaeales archaeon]
MNPLLGLLIGAAVFWTVFSILYRRLDLKKRGVTFESGAAVFRTRRGLQAIDSFAKRHPKFLLHFGNLAVVLALICCAFVLFNLCFNLYFILTKPRVALPGASIIFPGVIPGLTVYWWLITIGVLMGVHEVSHGLLMRVHDIPTKSTGALLLGVIPGAFVEPDEKKLASAPLSHRLRVYAAGSVANLLFSFFCLFLLLSLLTPKSGVYVWGVRKGGPSENLLEPGMRVVQIDNLRVESWKDLENLRWGYLENLQGFTPGQEVEILTEEGSFRVKADNFCSENRGSLGLYLNWAVPRAEFLNPLFAASVTVYELRGERIFHPLLYRSSVPWPVIDLLKWMFVLNLGVGLFNLLPMLPLDGGQMLQALLERKLPKKRARRICIYVSLAMLALVLLNILPYFLK